LDGAFTIDGWPLGNEAKALVMAMDSYGVEIEDLSSSSRVSHALVLEILDRAIHIAEGIGAAQEA
jgi:hypothetical protein